MKKLILLMIAVAMLSQCALFAQAPSPQASSPSDKDKDKKSDSLPSAPSAVVMPKEEAPPPPPPADTTPVLKSLTRAPDAQPTPPVKQGTKLKEEAKPAVLPPATSAKPDPKESDPAWLQKNEASNTSAAGNTIISRVREVSVVFTVSDKRGNFIKGLSKDDFKVHDDSSPVDQFRFTAQTDLPLRVGLLIDASSSIHEEFKFEQEAAVEFLNQIIKPKTDEAFVVGFDSTAEVVAKNKTQPFTNELEILTRGVRMIRPSGGTAMFDAIFMSCRDIFLKHPPTTVARNVIILISDGDDNVSHVTREEAIEFAQRAEVVVYTISTNLTGGSNKGDKIMERIADATGGRAFHPFKIQDVANAFSDIQAELRSQYLIAYRPVNLVADGRYRTIAIVTPEKKHRVRARTGYYAPKQ